MGDAHRQQAGDAAVAGLRAHRSIELPQAVEQLVGSRLHSDLDGVVEPGALGFLGRITDSLAQVGRVGEGIDVSRGVRDREQHVGGEQHLACRVGDGVGDQLLDGDGARRAQFADTCLLVSADADGLREERVPDRLGDLIGRGGSVERSDGSIPARSHCGIVCEHPGQLGVRLLEAPSVEHGQPGGVVGWPCEDGRRALVVGMPGSDGGDEERG